MSIRYTVLNNEGCPQLINPVSDGEYISEKMDAVYSELYAYFMFFNDENGVSPAQATAGTIKVELSMDDGITYNGIKNGEFPVSDLYDNTKEHVNARGLAIRAKVTLNGITGAPYFKVIFARY